MGKMDIYRIGIISLLLCNFLPCSLYAAQTPLTQRYIGLSTGPTWYRVGQTQTVWLQPGFANTYAAATPVQTLARGEIFAGIQHAFTNWGIGQFGLAIAANSSAKAQGEVWETGDPLFNNFTYTYRVSNVSILAKTKWFYEKLHDLYLPYVSAGVGIACTRSYGYAMNTLIFEALPISNFQNHLVTAFTYTLGLGIHKVITSHWQIGMGYEWSDWGQSALGNASGQTNGGTIKLNQLHTQQLQFTFNYFI